MPVLKKFLEKNQCDSSEVPLSSDNPLLWLSRLIFVWTLLSADSPLHSSFLMKVESQKQSVRSVGFLLIPVPLGKAKSCFLEQWQRGICFTGDGWVIDVWTPLEVFTLGSQGPINYAGQQATVYHLLYENLASVLLVLQVKQRELWSFTLRGGLPCF